MKNISKTISSNGFRYINSENEVDVVRSHSINMSSSELMVLIKNVQVVQMKIITSYKFGIAKYLSVQAFC